MTERGSFVIHRHLQITTELWRIPSSPLRDLFKRILWKLEYPWKQPIRRTVHFVWPYEDLSEFGKVPILRKGKLFMENISSIKRDFAGIGIVSDDPDFSISSHLFDEDSFLFCESEDIAYNIYGPIERHRKYLCLIR